MKDGATEALFLVCKMKLNFPNLYFYIKNMSVLKWKDFLLHNFLHVTLGKIF